MKSWNVTLLSLSLVGFVLITGLSTAYAKDGGANGGGGNVTKLSPASADDVRKILEGVQEPLTYIFNELEIDLNYDNNDPKIGLSSIDKSILQKLFTPDASGHRIFDQINSYKPNILTDKPCRNHENQKKPGSVFDTPPGTICFSLPWMIKDRQDLNSHNEFVQTLALAAHEYGHKQGLNEPEAKRLGDLVNKHVDDYARMWSLWHLELRQAIELNIYDISDNILNTSNEDNDQFFNLQKREGAGHFCILAETIFRGAQTAFDKYRDAREHGMSFVSMDDSKYIDALFFRSAQLSYACLGGFDGLNYFQGRGEIPMSEVTMKSNPPTKAPGVLRRTTLDTPDKIKLELQDLMSESGYLLNVIKDN